MPTFIIYGQPYHAGSQLISPTISIISAHPYAFYKHYDYFEVLSSNKQMPLTKHMVYYKSSADEWLTRARRTVLFSDMTQLTPAKFNRVKYGSLIDRSYKAMHCDHVTCWFSPFGTKFILNEPYYVDPNYVLKLREQGLVTLIVPTDLSPYCGYWNPNIGVKPRTTSYLICNLADAFELTQLFGIIDLENTPAWNCVKGIKHV